MPDFAQLFSITYYLLIIATIGMLQSTSVINLLITFELALLACSWNFIIYSLYIDDIRGQIFAIIILSVAGTESALGLAGLIAYSRLKGNILISSFIFLKS